MKQAALVVGLLLAGTGWALVPLSTAGHMTRHMAAHMIAVALAAPLLAYAASGTATDLAQRWPRIVTPMAMMLLELLTVWGWHLPAFRRAADSHAMMVLTEQASFLAAGFLLWSAALHGPARASGIGAMLLTSMHMTLLGVLIGLAPRPLYHGMHHADGLDPLGDQQLGGVVMLVIGGASYLVGGLALLATMLQEHRSVSR